VTRRQVLKGAALAVPASLVAGASISRQVPATENPGAFSMAMHLHTSFSEGPGSMESHLQQATLHDVDVLWWTDHDNTLGALVRKHAVHFTSLTDEEGDGPPWQWTEQRAGSLTADSGGGIVTSPASPLDPVPGGSMHLLAQSAGTDPATFAYFPMPVAAESTWKTNLTNQSVSIEVLPTSIGPEAFLDIVVVGSYHPAVAGRTAGQYSLSYRLGGQDRPGTRHSTDRVGVVTLGCTVGEWNSITIRPDHDIAALFPGVDSRDFSMCSIHLRAVSRASAPAEGYFDYLRFTRPTSGEVAVTLQHEMMASYAAAYPNPAQRKGIEISRSFPHVNWYGGEVVIPSWDGVTPENYLDYVRSSVVPDIHRSGGLASWNHPYGVSYAVPRSSAHQDAVLRRLALQMLPMQAGGVDILEVGYPSRGGADLARHVGLWDVMSRNAVFLTGNGVSDDHAGDDWARVFGGSDWLTHVWAPDKDERSLLSGMLAGRSWCASLPSYRGALDLLVDGSCPMGSVSVSSLSRRSLSVSATKLPVGATVEVVQGAVDYAGPEDPMPSTTRVATLTPDEVGSGAAVRVDTAASTFLRTQVRDAAGVVVALSNPVWLLRDNPPNGIPPHRTA
jgi:hypothetical protein